MKSLLASPLQHQVLASPLQHQVLLASPLQHQVLLASPLQHQVLLASPLHQVLLLITQLYSVHEVHGLPEHEMPFRAIVRQVKWPFRILHLDDLGSLHLSVETVEASHVRFG